ncbi:MAG: exosortase C-terminal domain/associated protein EpsI [Myxococcota bacterium]
MTAKIAAAFVFLVLNGYVYWYLGSAEVIPNRAEFSLFPDRLEDWRCVERESIDQKTIDNLMVTDYISCNFVNREQRASSHLYIGYHERQTRDRDSGKATAIHPPEHCLPGSGWDVIDSQVVPISLARNGVADGVQGEAKRFVIAKGNHRALVYFWYHSRGRVIAQSHHKILYMFLDRAREGRTDGSLVRFTIPIEHGDEEAAEATFQEFAGVVTPRLDDFVPN